MLISAQLLKIYTTTSSLNVIKNNNIRVKALIWFQKLKNELPWNVSKALKVSSHTKNICLTLTIKCEQNVSKNSEQQ